MCFFFLLQNIIHSSGSVQDKMAHYLYVLQSVTLNHLEPRMRTPLDCYSQVRHNRRNIRTSGWISFNHRLSSELFWDFFFPPLTPHSRSRETSFTVCVRRRSRRRARTVWATRDGAHSAPKSSRNWAFLWDSTVKIHRDIGLERWANLCSILVWRSQNNSNPGQDLVRTPPGLLALDTMFYFATRYPDAYSRVSAASP